MLDLGFVRANLALVEEKLRARGAIRLRSSAISTLSTGPAVTLSPLLNSSRPAATSSRNRSAP
jgi:hypothetical protein